MNHWIVGIVLLPGLLAAFITLILRYQLWLCRTFSVAGTLAFLAIAVGLAMQAGTGQTSVYALGDWPIPFGIILVADRLATLMLVSLGVLATIVVLYAIGSDWDTRGRHFHALFQFQLMGLAGAFLTGDVFNLFVFFEILLIASYGLIIHSGGARRLRVGVQYVVYNLLGSTLFLFALGTIYATLGTLNMADLAARVAELPPDQTALVRVGAVLLLLVFAVKAAVLPRHFWLPASYAAAPGPVAALFAIMSKVGAYAIIRVYTLIFPPTESTMQGMYDMWLMPAALLTLVIGMIGILGARQIEKLVAFAVLGSMGNLLVAIALFTEEGTGAALYYTTHSIFAAALLFLIADLTLGGRGAGGRIVAAPPIRGNGLIAAGFFAGAVALVGLPPLSGFIGKLLVLDAARDRPDQALIWAVILASSLIATIGFARAGSTLYWKSASVPPPEDAPPAPMPSVLAFAPPAAAIAVLVMLTAFAGPTLGYFSATAAQLYDRQSYVDAVFGTEANRPGLEELQKKLAEQKSDDGTEEVEETTE